MICVGRAYFSGAGGERQPSQALVIQLSFYLNSNLTKLSPIFSDFDFQSKFRLMYSFKPISSLPPSRTPRKSDKIICNFTEKKIELKNVAVNLATAIQAMTIFYRSAANSESNMKKKLAALKKSSHMEDSLWLTISMCLVNLFSN